MFKSLCQDPWGILELFMNYDMATDRADVFHRVISILASIARGSPASDTASRPPQEAATLKMLALQGIVTLVKSLSIIVDQSNNPLGGLASPPAEAAAAAGEDVTDDVPEDMSVSGTVASSANLVEEYDFRVSFAVLLGICPLVMPSR